MPWLFYRMLICITAMGSSATIRSVPFCPVQCIIYSDPLLVKVMKNYTVEGVWIYHCSPLDKSLGQTRDCEPEPEAWMVQYPGLQGEIFSD
jgi:hypothetical protein